MNLREKGDLRSPPRVTTQQGKVQIAPGVALSKGGKALISRLLLEDTKMAAPMGIGVTRENGTHLTKPTIRAVSLAGASRVLSSGLTPGLRPDTPACTAYTPTLDAALASKSAPADGKPTGNTHTFTSCFTGSETGRIPPRVNKLTAPAFPTESFPGRPLTPPSGVVPLSLSALADRFGPAIADFHETREEYHAYMQEKKLERGMFQHLMRGSELQKTALHDIANDLVENVPVNGGAESHDLSSMIRRRTGRLPSRTTTPQLPKSRGGGSCVREGKFDGWTSRSIVLVDPAHKSKLEISAERLAKPINQNAKLETTTLSPVAAERHERLYGHAQKKLDDERERQRMVRLNHEAEDESSVAFAELQNIVGGQFKVRKVPTPVDKMGRPISPVKPSQLAAGAVPAVELAKACLLGVDVPVDGSTIKAPLPVERVAKVAAIACESLNTTNHRSHCSQCGPQRAHSSTSHHRPNLQGSAATNMRPHTSQSHFSSHSILSSEFASSSSPDRQAQLRRGVGARTLGSHFSFGEIPFGMGVGEGVKGGVLAPQKLATPQEREEARRLRRLETHTPFQSHQLLLSKAEREAPDAMRKRQGEAGVFLRRHDGIGGGQVGSGTNQRHKEAVKRAKLAAQMEKEQHVKMQELEEKEELRRAEESQSLLQQRVDDQMNGIYHEGLSTPGVYRIIRKQPGDANQQSHQQASPDGRPLGAVPFTSNMLAKTRTFESRIDNVQDPKSGQHAGAMLDGDEGKDDPQVLRQYDGWGAHQFNNTMLIACSFGSAGNQHSLFHIADRPPCSNTRGAIATAGLGDAKVGAGSRGAKLNAATALPRRLTPDDNGFNYVPDPIPRVDHQRRKRQERKQRHSTHRDAAKEAHTDQTNAGVSLPGESPSRANRHTTPSANTAAKQAIVALSRNRGHVRGQSAMLINMFGTAEDLDVDEEVMAASRHLLGC